MTTTAAKAPLGNRVWFDTNNDGTQNGSEVGVAGVAVELYQDTNKDGVFTPGVDTVCLLYTSRCV